MTTHEDRRARIDALDPEEARTLLRVLAGIYPDAFDSTEAALADEAAARLRGPR